MVGYPSGQRGQTVNLLAYAFDGSNPSPTTTPASAKVRMFKTFNRKAALAAVYIEQYVLPLVYLLFAWMEFRIVLSLARSELPLWQIILAQPPVTKTAIFADAGRHIVLLLLNLFTALFLLMARRIDVLPQKAKDVIVPLIAAFFNLTYNVVPWFPVWAKKGLWPASLQTPPIAAGLLLCVFGPAVAIWAIFYLRRSFGIYVEVRKVIFGGPYRRVRHPMYLGYIFMLAGMALVNFSAAYLILVLIHIGLLLYRARLEETRLAEHSAEYREYMKRAGFLFPRLRRPAP